MFDYQKVKIVGITRPIIENIIGNYDPDIYKISSEDFISVCARVSNPDNKTNFKTSRKLLKYLINHSHFCYDDKTEVFTNVGWKLFKELTVEDKVAAISGWENENFQINFERPTSYYSSSYNGKMICGTSSSIDYCVTPNHRMLYKSLSDSNKIWCIDSAEKSYKKWKKFRKTAEAVDLSKNIDLYNIDYNIGILYGFCLGDGYQRSLNTISIRIKKNHKIQYLDNVLKILKDHVIYIKTKSSDGVMDYVFKNLPFSIGKSNNKKIDNLNFSIRSINYWLGVFHGLINSDGSDRKKKTGKSWTYCSTSEQLIKDIINLSTYFGYCVDIVKPMTMKSDNHNIAYGLTIKNRKVGEIRFDSVNGEEKYIDYNSNIYCCEVSTGMLLVRRNGKQFVSGNSPFEMVNVIYDITTTRDIGRQLLRHRSMCFQEKSGRYSEMILDLNLKRECRLQDHKNRQNSIDLDLTNIKHIELKNWWNNTQQEIQNFIGMKYEEALAKDIAKECARSILPEGLVYSDLYVNGTLRSWIHWIELREKNGTQKEHIDLAIKVKKSIIEEFPFLKEYWNV